MTGGWALGARGVDPRPIIDVEGVTKRYRRSPGPVLSDVSLTIPEGSFVALVGPNGAGKSTLLRCLIGFEHVSAGSIRVMGIDPQRDRPAALARVGYVSQSAGLYRDLTVDGHLDLAASLRKGFDRTGSALRLENLGIDPAALTGLLSGGQRAQVAIALALGTRAPILLLDEPLASLDPLARRDVLDLVSTAVRAEGITVVLASHIVAELEGACDHVVVLAPARVMLDEGIALARSRHAVVPATEAGEADRIGTFGHQDGINRTLVRAPSDRPQATLEEIVLGYLAAARTVGRGTTW